MALASATPHPPTLVARTGNLHELTAHVPRAVLDMLVPPCCPAPYPPTLVARTGNLHEFTAHAPCAVLDVLVPPYCPAP